MATRTKKTETPVVETEVETVETEAVEEAPAGTNVAGLLDEIEKAAGKVYKPATIRVLLRKLAAEGKIEKAEGRWNLSDDEVETVIEAVQAGRAEKEPKPEGEAKPKKTRAKKAEEPVEEEEPETEDDLDVDLDEL